jgi:hypothetical protein
MDQETQLRWLQSHIPHRIRAASAKLNVEHSLIGESLAIDHPNLDTPEKKFAWGCMTDSVWEGRLTATRWLIEFAGIKQSDGKPVTSVMLNPRFPDDVNITALDGGEPIPTSHALAQRLSDLWTRCSQATSHATKEKTDDEPMEAKIVEAVTLIMEHLQNTVYNKAGRSLRDDTAKEIIAAKASR